MHRAATPKLSTFLLTRGLWLIFLEFTLISFGWSFAVPWLPFMQVIWAIGLSMLALAALLWLPVRGQVALGLLIIGGHNLLDSVHFAGGSAAHVPWAILHDRSMIALGEGLRVRTSYPVLPWIGVILLGWCAGPLYSKLVDSSRRTKALLLLGLGCLAIPAHGLGVVLRGAAAVLVERGGDLAHGVALDPHLFVRERVRRGV